MTVVFETLFLIKSLFGLNIMMQPFLCLMYKYIEINPISFLDDEYCSAALEAERLIYIDTIY